MTDQDDISVGEIARAVKRLEAAVEHMSNKMTVVLGPIGELRVHVENAQKDIDELGGVMRTNSARIDKIELRAAAVAGGMTAIGFLLKFLILGK